MEMNRRGLRSQNPEITEAAFNVARLNVAIANKRKSDKRKQKEAQPMAKRTKEKPVILTADKFKEIKHMDRTQLEKYLIEIYLRGSRDAKAAAGFDIDKALEAISQIKVIGPGKLKEIERALKGAEIGNETQ